MRELAYENEEMMAAAVTALIEAAAALTAKSVAVTERAAAVYRRGRWLISNVSDVRIMWNITVDLPQCV
jgi:hypothetical protein